MRKKIPTTGTTAEKAPDALRLVRSDGGRNGARSPTPAADVIVAEVTVAECTPSEAKQLTGRIRQAAKNVCRLLTEAHDKRAWAALGYDTFKDYVRTEFGMTDSRARQLLGQEKVIQAIEAASGVTAVTVTEREARDLIPHLPQVVDRVRRETKGKTLAEAKAIVTTVVRTERASTQVKKAVTDPSADRQIDTVHPILRALETLATAPPPTEVLAAVSESNRLRVDQSMAAAADWLTAFREAWNWEAQ